MDGVHIPLLDLQAQHDGIKGELDAALEKCIGEAGFVGGSDHAAFQEEFAAFCGGGHVALTGNCTDALTQTLLAHLGPGDGKAEIITVAHTFMATVEAIIGAGYEPRFVDIDARTYCMSPETLAGIIGENTRAVLPVHIYGQMAAMDTIMAIAERHGIAVIEDAAQAHGAAWRGKGPGHWGAAACYSFYPGKILGAWGDGGATFTRDGDLAEHLRRVVDHGRSDKYIHEFVGVSSRLDGLQAAILRVKLRHVEDWTNARIRIARCYQERLQGIESVQAPYADPDARHVFHIYAVQVADRDRVFERMRANGIGVGIHYPVPLHRQPALRDRQCANSDLPETDRVAGRVLSLPIYPEMSDAAIDAVSNALIEATGG